MKYTLRALLAVGVLAGFYVCAVAIVVALSYGGYLLTTVDLTVGAIKVWLICGGVALALAAGIVSRRERPPPDVGGLLLEEAEHSGLWRVVRELAGFAGTRAPDEIRLLPGVNAGVQEDTKLPGLVGGTRRLAIGAGLLIGLSVEQVRAVLAHELGHYSHRHTTFGATVYRGTEAITRVLAEFEGNIVHVPLELYGRLYLRVAQAVNRHQEFEADRLMAELVGPTTAIEALKQTNAVQEALDSFFNDYVVPGVELGCRPLDLFDGFRRFVAHPERQAQLAELRATVSDSPPSAYDSHPTTSQRVAAIQDIAGKGDGADSSGPAVDLLADGQSTLAELGDLLFDRSGLRPADFEEIAGLTATARSAHNAAVFLTAIAGRDIASPTLAGAMAVLKEGRPEALLELVDLDDQDAVSSTVGVLLGETIAQCLTADATATYRLDWAGSPRLVDAAGELLDPWSLAYEALTGGATAVAVLDEWLDHRAVFRDREVAPPQQDLPPPEPARWLALIAPVKEKIWGRDLVLGVVDSGLLVYRTRYADRVATRGILSDPGTSYIERFAGYLPADLLAEAGATYLPWGSIASVTVRRTRFSLTTMVVSADDGSTWRFRWSVSAHIAGDVSSLYRYLGDRLSVAPSAAAFRDLVHGRSLVKWITVISS